MTGLNLMTGVKRLLLLTTFLMLSFLVTNVQADENEANRLSLDEELSGWKLLFDGKSLDNFRNYQKENISSGWKIIDGAIVRAEKGAGDIITKEMYENFELMLDFKIEKGGNSGLMFMVTEEEKTPWQTGPEIQINDHFNGSDKQKCGWLYQLYSPSPYSWNLFNGFEKPDLPEAPDAFRGHDQWNQYYLKVENGQVTLLFNGIRYYVVKPGSKDWNDRVAKSKFSSLEKFGKAAKGHICLQDHNNLVSFRNIKIRDLSDKTKIYDISTGKAPVKAVPAFTQIQWEGWEPVGPDGKAVPFRPIEIGHYNDGSGLMLVAEQHGRIYSLRKNGTTGESKAVLDIQSLVSYSDKMNEEGLLGVVTHPKYKQNKQLFACYTSIKEPHVSVVSRFTIDPAATAEMNGSTEEVLMKIPQPFWNHNGGTIAFGHDGFLYIGMGDGGAGDDPYNHAQNKNVLFGKVLRIDVDHKGEKTPYAIPADNPFVNETHARPEIFAFGVRNPWRFSFDRKNGDLWLCDVGQNLFEEINLVPKGGNLGWNIREGNYPFGMKGTVDSSKLVEPVFRYDHGIGKSITGGIMYRGSKNPELADHFLYGDYVAGKIYALKIDSKTKKAVSNHRIESPNVTVITFGEDESGEVYFTMVDSKGLGIYTFESEPKPNAGIQMNRQIRIIVD